MGVSATPEDGSLAGVERLRLQLQNNLQTLQKALRHWQTWEAEYEGLKEELQDLPANTSEQELSRIAEEYESDLITEKEIKELFGQDNGWLRNPRQISGLIDRRIDYVHRNVETLVKQRTTVESKLDNIAVIAQPDALNEDGLPIQDIYEELDADGNVISSRVSRPGELESEILSVLGKAGLKVEDIPSGIETQSDPAQDSNKTSQPMSFESPNTVSTMEKPHSTAAVSALKQSPPATAVDGSSSTTLPSRPRKKSVSFAPDTKAEPIASIPAPIAASPVITVPVTTKLSPLAKGTFSDADRVVELDEDENPIAIKLPREPIDESPEAALLRRQMLEYNLREIGDIVAQIDIDENDDDDRSDSVMEEDDEDDDYDMDGLDLDEDSVDEGAEDENEFGISRNGVITEAYMKEMTELEQKLKARVFQNIGPGADTTEMLAPDQSHNDASASKVLATTSSGPKEKAVRFVENLDVAPILSSRVTTETMQDDIADPAPPIKDTIVERAPRPTPDSSFAAPSKKPSRFKASRQPAPRPDPQPIPHRSATNPLAPQIIERPVKTTAAAHASNGAAEPDEFDPAIQRQQVVDEYYKTRNRLVAKEGGFSRRQDDDLVDEDEAEFTDDEDVPRKKVSLFKAARVKGTGNGR